MSRTDRYLRLVSITGVLSVLLLFLIGFFIYMKVSENNRWYLYRLNNSIPEINDVVSLELQSNKKAIFVLGCGYFGENYYYYYYEKYDDGSMKLVREKASKVFIIEYDGRPKVYKRYGIKKLYVPKGTIKRDIYIKV